MRSKRDFHARLGDPRRYEREIERLHQKHLFSAALFELRQDDVALARLIQRRGKVGKLLARAVSRGEYEPEPGEVREIEADGKVRAVVSYTLTDTIVRGAVSTLLEEAIAPLLSDRLYSYRPGVSWLEPSAGLAAFIRTHRRERPDPRTRGLYVLRRDVDSYTDTIPVDPGSPVWKMLRDVLERAGAGATIPGPHWRLVEQTIRPELRELGGGFGCRIRGVPTGQPVSCVLFNLYLNELDHVLAGVSGGFYARYSDDILFAHPDAETARRAAETIETRVSDLRLRIKPEKASNLYLTAAGRPSTEWEETKPTSSVPFVGTSVFAAGTVALNRKKLRRVLREIERRALRTAHAARGSSRDSLGRAVCSVVNDSVAPRPSPLQQASAPLLARAVTDRSQLAQIDYRLARLVVKAVTGDGGVRAFRRVPYRTVREEWGLVSLEHARNCA
jgi:Reverse transcriptase (RNA-dependent DNA polymerase)